MSKLPGENMTGAWTHAAQAASAAGYHEAADDNIMLRKNHEAMGATLPADRPRALDLLGVSSQLVFTTFCLSNFGLDQGDDMDLCYGAADAHNRMMRDFCSVSIKDCSMSLMCRWKILTAAQPWRKQPLKTEPRR